MTSEHKVKQLKILYRISLLLLVLFWLLFSFKIIFYWLCYWTVCPPPPSTTHSLKQSPHHCSCPWVMCISSLASPFPILYFIPPWLFCNYLFVLLNPLASTPIPSHSPPIWHPSKCSLYPWFCLCFSCLLSLFFRFKC